MQKKKGCQGVIPDTYEFEFSLADIEANGICPLGNLKNQGRRPHCMIYSSATAAEVTERITKILMGEEVKNEDPLICMTTFMNKLKLKKHLARSVNIESFGDLGYKDLRKILGILEKGVNIKDSSEVCKISGISEVAQDFPLICKDLAEGNPLLAIIRTGKGFDALKWNEIYKPPKKSAIVEGKSEGLHCITLVGGGMRTKRKMYYKYINSHGIDFCPLSNLKRKDGIQGGFGNIVAEGLLRRPVKLIRYREGVTRDSDLSCPKPQGRSIGGRIHRPAATLKRQYCILDERYPLSKLQLQMPVTPQPSVSNNMLQLRHLKQQEQQLLQQQQGMQQQSHRHSTQQIGYLSYGPFSLTHDRLITQRILELAQILPGQSMHKINSRASAMVTGMDVLGFSGSKTLELPHKLIACSSWNECCASLDKNGEGFGDVTNPMKDLENADGSSSKISRLHDLSAEELLVRLNGVYAVMIHNANDTAVHPLAQYLILSDIHCLDDSDFIEVKDSLMEGNRAMKSNNGSVVNTLAPLGLFNPLVMSVHIEKGKLGEQVQQETYMIPSQPSGTSLDLVPWKNDQAKALPGSSWSAKPTKLQKKPLWPLIRVQSEGGSRPCKLQQLKLASFFGKAPMMQCSHWNYSSWEGSGSPSARASQCLLVTLRVSSDSINDEYKAYWGPFEQANLDEKLRFQSKNSSYVVNVGVNHSVNRKQRLLISMKAPHTLPCF